MKKRAPAFVISAVLLGLTIQPLRSQDISASTTPAIERVLVSSAAVPFETERLVYDEKTGLAHFHDGFKLWHGSQTLSGREMAFDVAAGVALASGSLTLDDPNLILQGERLRSHVSSQTFKWESPVRGVFKTTPWRFTAKNLEGTDKFYKANSVRFTSCDKLNPDYYIWSYKGKIWPGQKASFTHAVFHIGKIPFWYWPYYTKSLGQKARPTVYLNPGQNGREGTFLRSVIAYPLAGDRLYLRTHLDYFSKIGLGIGPEFLYRENESRKGALYLYRVKEPNGLTQWDVRGDSYYEFIPGLAGQGTLRYQRDPSFNNLYSKDNPERVMPSLNSSLALNWSRSNYQLRSFYSDVWGFDQKTGKFMSTAQVLPGLEAILHPWRIFSSPLFFQGNATAHRTRTRASFEEIPFDRWVDSGNSKLFIPWRMPFVSFLSGTAGGTFEHSYESRLAKTIPQSRRQSRYGGEMLARMAPWDPLDLTFTYIYKLRSEVDSLRQETKAPDKGVDAKRLEVQEIGRLSYFANLYARTAYNFPRAPFAETGNAGKYPIDWTQGLDPVWGSLTILPLPGASWNFSTSYEVFARKYNHTIALSQAVGPALILNGNFQYDNRKPNYLLPTAMAEFKVPRFFEQVRITWRGEYFAKTQCLSSRKLTMRTFEREIALVPDFHDFLVTLVFRSRKEVREFYFTIQMRFSQQTEEKLLRQLKEQEFFPWRGRQN
ncbi:MAG: LPS-assembly protein LptD [Elusimicrobia bacterium]|nr:LPS-assembly protein LptD [Elusimicrobiota bacterium]